MDFSAVRAARSHSVAARETVAELVERGAVVAALTCRHCGAAAGQAVVDGAMLVKRKCGNRRCRKFFTRVLPPGRTEMDVRPMAGLPFGRFLMRCSRCSDRLGFDFIFGRVTVSGHGRLDLTCPGCGTGLTWPPNRRAPREASLPRA